MLLNPNGSFTDALLELLHAVAGVDRHLLSRARVFPHTANWLNFPWYPKKRGGAFVLGKRIYLKSRSLDGAYVSDGPEHIGSLLLLAHEVGHLPQAERFGIDNFGKVRFVCWAAGQYACSALRNGMKAHDLALLELEADEGRWVLKRLLYHTGTAQPMHVITQILRNNDSEQMRNWLLEQRTMIEDLRRDYKRKYLR